MTILNQKYRRGKSSLGVSVVHRAECKTAAKGSLPWDYADNMTAAEIALLVLRTPWLKACVRCKPSKEGK